MNKVELLAPAGDLEKLKIALIYGADAVFIGGLRFSLRARASNFTIKDIKEACEFAHKLNKKVYVTCNIVPRNSDLEGLKEYLMDLEKCKVDAIIVSSPVIIEVAKKYTNLEIHLSTQMSVTNSSACLFFRDLGIKRVVLARELTLKEIEKIKKDTNMDLEVFIHGGMCASYSGRCTLSNNMTERDANRGGCAHSCRWNYRLFDNEERISEDEYFTMNSKDLCGISHIPDLLKIGVDSLKIEGRMKSLHYIATVCYSYRMIIDDYYNNCLKDFAYYEQEILKAENRKTSVGFFEGLPTIYEQLYDSRSEIPTKEFVAQVIDYDEVTHIATLEQRNYFTKDDTLERMSPNTSVLKFNIDNIYDKDMNVLDAARHPLQIIKIETDVKLKKYDFIRKAK